MHQQIAEILSCAGKENSSISPSELYNESWMLRLLLSHISSMPLPGHKLSFFEGALWFSEALLPSPFLPRYRGDPLAEGWTHADGVIGHFTISLNARSDLSLNEDAKQLYVIEAKMFSGLSSGVRNCSYYNQAARNVACMAEVLKRANTKPTSLLNLGFFVIAPQSQIDAGIFSNMVTTDDILDTVKKRCDTYGEEKILWFDRWFLPTLETTKVDLYSWEELLPDDEISLQNFYEKCIHFNQQRQ